MITTKEENTETVLCPLHRSLSNKGMRRKLWTDKSIARNREASQEVVEAIFAQFSIDKEAAQYQGGFHSTF
jgi:hypothetical protein